MRKTLLASVIAGLVFVSAAGGYVAGRVVSVNNGDTARFLPSLWQCNNHGGSIDCYSGDAMPYAVLTSSRRGGVTTAVHTLSGGGVQVKNVHHPAAAGLGSYDEIVYTFTALR